MMKKAWVFAIGFAAALACTAASARTVYYHNDIAGTPIAATNESGAVLWRESYRPYGERLTNSAASSGNDVWFTSRRQDVDSGLVYMGARYYDPVVGRFISTDPVGVDEANVHGFNRYAYANNNPLRYTDPDGRFAVPLGRIVFTAAYEAATALGAARLGGFVGGALWAILNESGADSEAGAAQNSPAASDRPNTDGEKDGKRNFDRDQRAKALDRAKDESGVPRCAYCGQSLANESGQPNSAEIDHVTAHSRGGKTIEDNSAASCRTCNRSKGAKELDTEWVPPSSR
jgi:RHS repeat-associated protein